MLLDLASNAHRAFIRYLLKICCRLVVFRRVEETAIALFFGFLLGLLEVFVKDKLLVSLGVEGLAASSAVFHSLQNRLALVRADIIIHQLYFMGCLFIVTELRHHTKLILNVVLNDIPLQHEQPVCIGSDLGRLGLVSLSMQHLVLVVIRTTVALKAPVFHLRCHLACLWAFIYLAATEVTESLGRRRLQIV